MYDLDEHLDATNGHLGAIFRLAFECIQMVTLVYKVDEHLDACIISCNASKEENLGA